MNINKTQILIILALTVFCGELLASPFMDCCEMKQHSALEIARMGEIGEKDDPHHTIEIDITKVELPKMSINDLDNNQDHFTHDMSSAMLSVDCELHCNFCFGTYSLSGWGSNTQLLNVPPLSVEDRSLFFLSLLYPENLLRPPIVA